MRISAFIAALGIMPLAGCALVQSNVKGGFACSAPHGICAPSSTIDDSAIHAIDAQSDSKNAPPTPDAEGDAPQPKTTENPKEKKAWTFVGPVRPVLKIVYLPWRDASGRLHPRTTGFVPVDAPQLAEASSGPLDAKAMGAGSDMSLLNLAEMAPDMALMNPTAKPATAAKAVALPVTGTAQEAAPIPAKDPVAAIKAQVKEILNQPKPGKDTAKPTPTSFPPTGD
jgi:hypothetical protein